MARGVWKGKQVGVLMGGWSRERDISLKSGWAVSTALKKQGYQVEAIDIRDDLSDFLTHRPVDVVFVALHGPYGEDGCVQGLLECLHIPYTGSGVTASAVCLDKDLTRKLVEAMGVTIPRGLLVTQGDDLNSVQTTLADRLPLIV